MDYSRLLLVALARPRAIQHVIETYEPLRSRNGYVFDKKSFGEHLSDIERILLARYSLAFSIRTNFMNRTLGLNIEY